MCLCVCLCMCEGNNNLICVRTLSCFSAFFFPPCISSLIYSCPAPCPAHPSLQPPEDIVSVAWNRQVEHIVASASPSGRCVVWDLRKNQPVITVSDTSSRVSGEWVGSAGVEVVASQPLCLLVCTAFHLRFAPPTTSTYVRT